MTRHVVQLVLASIAAVGAAVVWSQVRSWVDVPPLTDGQPATVSVVYDPPQMMLAWLLATLAGVLVVLAVSGLRRVRKITVAGHTP